MLVMVVLHTIGALMAFGFGCVYMWMQVPLTFATRPELSSLFVSFVRVVLAILASIIFIFSILRAVLVLHMLERQTSDSYNQRVSYFVTKYKHKVEVHFIVLKCYQVG